MPPQRKNLHPGRCPELTWFACELQTTPKKIKHKRKKVKMAILKYYKVGSDGKIQRLRRECE